MKYDKRKSFDALQKYIARYLKGAHLKDIGHNRWCAVGCQYEQAHIARKAISVGLYVRFIRSEPDPYHAMIVYA